MPPERIGRYRITGTLGVGGMGEVLQGWDDELQRPVAIKGLLHGHAAPEQRARLHREALSVAALSHPNIAHIYEVASDGERDWLVMEFVDGSSLSAVAKQGPLAASEVARIGAAVADALSFAHERGIIHRDVKADNVMITKAGHVKVLDFGLAKWTGERPRGDNLTAEGLVVGTTKAMSPEQALGKELDARTDVFSLGSLLFELACGQAPFQGATPAETMHRVAGCEHEPIQRINPRIPAALRRVIERCMARRPGDRYSSAADVAAALQSADLIAGTAVLTRPLRVTELYSTVRRHWLPALAVAVCLALLAAAAVRFGWLASPRPLLVAVLPPTVSETGDAATLAAAAVGDAVVSRLARLAGVVAVSGREVRAVAQDGRRPSEVARELGVQELVETSLTRGDEGGTWRVTMARVEGESGRILWSKTIEIASEDLLIVQDRVITTLEDAYRGYSTAWAAPPREAGSEALRAYLSASARLQSGQVSSGYDEEIALLRTAIAASPRFLDPIVDLAAIHRYLFASTHDPAHREQLEDLLTRALELAPDDPKVRLAQVTAAMAKGETQTAVELARSLTRTRPGDPLAWAEYGRTLGALGRHEEAERALRRSYALRPAWLTLYMLADVRRSCGDYAGAREALAPVVRDAPMNVTALAKLAEVEMYAGRYETSEALYRQVVSQRGSKPDLINLGNAVFFQGRYGESIELYRRASALAPHDPLAVANLADGLLWSGDREGALAEYRRALVLCEKQLDSGRRTRTLLDLRARCLANLGRGEEAVLAAQEAIQEFPDNPETVFVAALVAAINGDDTTCLAWTRRAIQLNAPRSWFGGPEFKRLRGDPAFRALVDSAR